jgi:hypothetical protein
MEQRSGRKRNFFDSVLLSARTQQAALPIAMQTCWSTFKYALQHVAAKKEETNELYGNWTTVKNNEHKPDDAIVPKAIGIMVSNTEG